jgi:hypothetical protein
MSVLLLAIGTTRARAVCGCAAFLLERGVAVDLVTVAPEPWRAEGLDDRVRVLTLHGGEERHPLRRVERFLVFRLPEVLFQLLRTVRRLPGVGRPADKALVTIQRVQQRAANAFHEKVFGRFYRLIRPYVLWRITRREVIRQVDWNTVQQVVICDSHAIPIGWLLAKRHRGLAVGFELDRAPYLERVPAGVPGA